MGRERKSDNSLTKLSELTIRDDQRAKCAETIQSLIAMLLGSILINWRTRKRGVCSADLLRLPDEVLEKIAFVLCEEEVFRLLDDVTEISDQSLSFARKLVGWFRESLRFHEAIESNVDLLILGKLAFALKV